MLEIVWQYDPQRPTTDSKPQTAVEALHALDSGNATFADLTNLAGHDETTSERHIMPLAARDLGLASEAGDSLPQEPFTAIVGCADARVPLEVIFGVQSNNAFVVRVAGHVLGNECLGSLEYAVGNLHTVRLLVVLGHTQCGAVSTAVDAYLEPTSYLQIATSLPLRSIVDSLMVPVNAAAQSLSKVHGASIVLHSGYRTALIEVAVALNAALTAGTMAHHFASSLSSDLGVAFGVFDLRTRRVGLPSWNDSTNDWQGGLFVPPHDESGFQDLGRHLASSYYIKHILK
jgi:carbonic anhydrase